MVGVCRSYFNVPPIWPCALLFNAEENEDQEKNKKGVEYEINVGLFWATHDDDVFQLFMHCRHKTTVKNQLAVVIGKKTDQSGFLKT